MKICCSCKEEKSTKEFYRKTKTQKQAMCKRCFNNYTTQRWIDRKIVEINKKGGKCLDCKIQLQNTHYSIFEFHHLDPTQKDFMWTKLRLRSQDAVDSELAKCVLLCANCHRLRHYNKPLS